MDWLQGLIASRHTPCLDSAVNLVVEVSALQRYVKKAFHSWEQSIRLGRALAFQGNQLRPAWNRYGHGESNCSIETQPPEGVRYALPESDFCPVLRMSQQRDLPKRN
jgi:hypothetical protein